MLRLRQLDMHTLVPITTGFDIVLSQSCVTQGRIVMVAKRAQILIGGSKIKNGNNGKIEDHGKF